MTRSSGRGCARWSAAAVSGCCRTGSPAPTGTTCVLADGTAVPVTSVLWCTGFRPDQPWLDVPGAVDDEGAPLHDGGASPVPGLHWMGLPWQTRLNSSIIDGVDRDARATAERITAARRSRPARIDQLLEEDHR